MGCGGRSKYDDLRPEQKWDFISLNDFKSSSCFKVTAYGYLWVSLFISVAVYGVDTFTAVNLLAFDKFTGIEPKIPLSITKWIICGCVILSWLNVGYEQFRAYRVIKRGAVAESFLDSLAVRLQCIRITKEGRGWRRFLVFSELASSKKGAEYVALFTYFAFQSWIRVIFCSGPRQVVNAYTLYSVLESNVDKSVTDVGASIVHFFQNIGLLAEKDKQQAVILGGMLFTLIIWVFAALSLILAFLFYVLFLWHYIPNSDGGLSGYCERKVNKSLTKIVSAKVNKAIEEEERKKLKAARKAAGKSGKDEKPIMGRQATLPTLLNSQEGDELQDMPGLKRNDTMSSLPQYSSRPGTPSSQQPTLPGLELENLGQKRPYAPSRMGTNASVSSMTSNAPLMGGASEMGYGGQASPAPTLPNIENANGYPFPQRSMTGNSSNTSFSRPGPPVRGPTPLSRQQTNDDYFSGSMDPVRPQDMFNVAPAPFIDSQSMRSQSPGPNRFDAYGRPINGSTSSSRMRPDPYGLPEMPASNPRATPAPHFISEMPGSSVMDRSATPTVPFLGLELPGSTPTPAPSSQPTIPSFAVEMPAPGSTPAPRFAELAVGGNEGGRSSPAPSQFSAMNNNGGRNSPIPRMPFTASPAPMTPAAAYALPVSNDASGYASHNSGNAPYQPGMRSASAGPSGQNGNGPTQSPRNPYRNLTETGMGGPARMGTPQGGPNNGGRSTPQSGYHSYQASDGSSARGGGPGAPGEYRR